MYYDECHQRAVKVTHPNRFGHSTYAPNLGATPAEYLRRLARCNLFFGDDFQILGVIYNGEEVQIVSSQPWIVDDKDHPPEAEEIASYFREFGFVPVSDDPNVPLFYNEAYGLLVADAHDNNVIRSSSGALAQIDIVIGVPGPRVIEEYALVWPGANQRKSN